MYFLIILKPGGLKVLENNNVDLAERVVKKNSAQVSTGKGVLWKLTGFVLC